MMRRLIGLATVAAVVVGLAGTADDVRAGMSGTEQLDSLAVRKSVSARADAAGQVSDARLLTRLSARGRGDVTIVDPTSTAGLRDLDRLLPPRVRDGAAVWDLDLEGAEVRRSLARYPADRLPVTVDARYTLDGVPVTAEELAGASGEVTARYLVRNVTSEPREIAYGTVNGEVTEEVEVAVPLVGRLGAELDGRWLDVRSETATIAADAEGTRILWTMGLFEPLGALTHELELRGRIEGGGAPSVTLEVAPVAAARSAELRAGRDALSDGQADAAVLAFGLEQAGVGLEDAIDGVGSLLGGLAELGGGIEAVAGGMGGAAAGASELAGGSAGAAEGAQALAGGASEIASGGWELASGTDQLASGLGELAVGISQAAAGLEALRGGAGQLAGGAGELSRGADALATGLDEAVDGIGALAGAIPTVETGPLADILGGSAAALGAVQDALEAQAPLQRNLAEMVDRTDEVIDLLGEARGGSDDPARIDAAVAAAEELRAAAVAGLNDIDRLTGELSGVLAGVATGLESALVALETLEAFDPGALVGGLEELAAGARAVAGGVSEVARGAEELEAGLAAGSAGFEGLAGGAGGAAAAASDLAGGAWILAGGLGELAAGTGELAGGMRALAAGAGELAAGLAQLAGGTEALAAGVGEAVEGVAQLEGGLQQLADEALDLLRRAADATAADLARDLARIEALEDRAPDGIPYGAPADAEVSAGYAITLAGTEPARLPPVGRTGAGLALLGLAVLASRAVAGRFGTAP